MTAINNWATRRKILHEFHISNSSTPLTMCTATWSHVFSKLKESTAPTRIHRKKTKLLIIRLIKCETLKGKCDMFNKNILGLENVSSIKPTKASAECREVARLNRPLLANISRQKIRQRSDMLSLRRLAIPVAVCSLFEASLLNLTLISRQNCNMNCWQLSPRSE